VVEIVVAQNADSFNPPDVQALIARCQHGELDAFEELVSRYQRYVFNIVYQHLGEPSEVEDAAQEVFLRIFKSIKRFRGTSSLETWIYRIALNYVRSQHRRRSLLVRLFVQPPAHTEDARGFDLISSLAANTRDPAATAEHHRLAEEIMKVVMQLPPLYREVLVMREMQELGYEEIAEILGLPVGTVRSRLHEARRLFAKCWKELMCDEN